MYANKTLWACFFSFGGIDIPLLYKSRFVCAHIGQNRHIYPPSIFHIHFDSRHPPPFAQVDGGGCYREKFFYFFLFSFGFRFDSVFRIILFNYFDSIKVRHLILDSIFRNICVLTRLIFARYSLSVLRYVYSYQFWLVPALQILCFNSSTLYLFNSSACCKQTFMLMWVCFMLVLAILRLSDVFSSVLGVVYRLGLK